MTLAEAEVEYEAAKAERDAAMADYERAGKRKWQALDQLRAAERALSDLRDLAMHQRRPAPVWIDRPFAQDADHRVYSVDGGGAIRIQNRYRYSYRYNAKTGYLYGARGPTKTDGGRLDVAATLRALAEVTP